MIAPPQYKNISNLSILNTDLVKSIDHETFLYDKFVLSLVELCICEKADVFITSPTNVPNKNLTHARSTFSLHTKNLRDLSNKYPHDVCINNIYNNEFVCDENVQQTKKIHK